MASSVGYGLLHSLIQNGDRFSSLSDYGISEDHFFEKELDAYKFIKNFILEHSQYPHAGTVARHIGELSVFDIIEDEPVAYWIEEVKQRKRFFDIRDTLLQVKSHMDSGEILNAINSMGHSYLKLKESYTTQRIEDLRELQQQVLSKHDEVQNSVDLPGISFGFPFIDVLTGGAQAGDYIAIAGQTGVGKTYLALKMAKAGHDSGANVIAVSTEMPTLQAARRMLAMEGKFSTTDIKMGRLSHFGRTRAQMIIDHGVARDTGNDNWFYFLPGGMFSQVEDIIILAKEMKPDILIVDGAYLLQTKAASWWEKNMDVASKLKNLSLTENIPTIGTYQFLKKDAGKLEGVGGGFAIPQIASIMFSFEYERKEDIENNNEVQYRKLKFIKGRDGESGAVRVLFNMRRTSLDQDRVLSGQIDPDERISRADESRELDENEVEEI